MPTLASIAGYQASARQQMLYSKGGAAFGSDSFWYSNVQIGGSPGAAGGPGNTAAGIVPVSPATGYPTIYAGTGTTYITAVEASLLSSNATFSGFRYLLADLLWYGGTYTPSATVTLASQPSFVSRLPGASYQGLQLWLEGNHGNQLSGASNYVITYTNQSGVAGQSTPTVSPDGSGSNVGLEAVQVALAAGDTGIQKVESVIGTGAGQRNVNVMIIRPLAYGRVDWRRNGGVSRQWFDRTTAPIIYNNSALITLVSANGVGSTLSTVPLELAIELTSYDAAVTGVGWNPSDKSSNVTLSNSNLTAAASGGGDGQTRATLSRSAGKFYFEIRADSGTNSSNPFMGIKPLTTALNSNSSGPFGTGGDYGCFMASPNTGHFDYVPGNNVFSTGPAIAAGDVFMFAVDLSAGKLWIGLNGTWDNGGNPATAASPIATGLSGTFAPSCDVDACTVTARFTRSAMTYTVPSGFLAWDGT